MKEPKETEKPMCYVMLPRLVQFHFLVAYVDFSQT